MQAERSERLGTTAPAQAVDLEKPLRRLASAAKYLRNKVVETRGVKCMDDLDEAINAVERALIDTQKEARND